MLKHISSILISILAISILLVSFAQSTKAQVVPAQNQIIPSAYFGDGYLISTSTSATHKLGAALVDLAGSFVTGTLGVANGGTGSTTLTGILRGNGTGQISTTVIGSGLTFDGTTLSASGSGSGNVATSTNETSGFLAYWTSTNGTPALLGKTATSSLSGTANQISISNSPSIIGSSGAVLTLPNHVIFPSSFFATNASTTNATSTNFTAHTIFADASDGLLIQANNGTDVAIFGAGNTANSLFYGGVNIDGATRIATSITGPLQAVAGAVTSTSTISTVFGGTGLSTLPTYGQVLVGNSTGGYTLTATSSLGITGGSGITAIGPTGQTQTGPTVTVATSTASFNGLTIGTTVVGSVNTLTWTPSLSGTLGIGGGGTGAGSFTNDAVIYEDAGVLSSDSDFIYDPTGNAGNGLLYVNQIESGAGLSLAVVGANGLSIDSTAGDINVRANGELYLSNDNGSTRVGINSGLQTVDGTIVSFPDTAGAADTFCLETLANCSGSGSPAGSDGQIQYNNGGAFGGASGLVWDDVNSKVGIGTSSPWGVLSVEGSTGWEAPVFAFGTTSGNIYSALMSGFASSSLKGARNIEGDTGARVSIGRPQIGVSNPFALFVSGPVSSSWKYVNCNPMPWLQVNITADTNSVCGTMAYDEVSAGTLANITSSATSMHGWSSTITSGTIADGSVLYLSGGVANYGTTTPILEGVIGPANTPFSTTTTRFFGFANNTNGPTVGQACGFIATSTTSTWKYICSNGGVMSIGDTGISTTTTEVKMRVEFTSATKVNFYIKTDYYSSMTYLGAHTIAWSNVIYPVHGVYRAVGGTAIAPVLSLFGYSYWLQSLYEIIQ